jgi:hypothetical protein
MAGEEESGKCIEILIINGHRRLKCRSLLKAGKTELAASAY